MGSTLSDIVQKIQQILRDEFNPDVTGEWTEDEIKVHIDLCLNEISDHSPARLTMPVLTIAGSKMLDVSGLSNTIRIRAVEYPIGQDPRKLRNFSKLDYQTIEMNVDATPVAGESGTLTGTVTFTSGSATVTGSGTDFSGELAKDYFIKPSTKSKWYRVVSVASATSLTLEEPVKSIDAGADTANVTQYRYEVALIHYDALHTLRDDLSTIGPREEVALVYGVSGHTAISKARTFINAINDGGGNTPSAMQNWGVTQIQLYQQTLRRFPPMDKTKYSAG